MRQVWRAWDSRYEVSDHGRVRNSKTKKLVAQDPNHGGYLRVRLRCDDGKRRWRRVHVLVLETFVGPRPSPRHVGAHFPVNDKQNNRLENLRWATPEENESHKKLVGTTTGGRSYTLKPIELEVIRQRRKTGESYSKIARDFGIHRRSVPRALARTA
jgi:hypothetical protein